MATLDFPSNPNTGTVYLGTNDVTYTFDGVKWIGLSNKGFSGFSGISGYSGSGFSGISGYSGSGFSGISGYSGFSGISGYSGFSGISGYSGSSATESTTSTLVNNGFVAELTSNGEFNLPLEAITQKATIGSTSDLQLIANSSTWTYTTTGTIVFPDNTEQFTAAQPFNTSTLVSNAVTATFAEKAFLVESPLSITQFNETFNQISNAQNIVTHDCSTGNIFDHTNIANSFTVNLTNLNLDSGKATSVVLLLNQTSTSFMSTGLQISNVSQTIKWVGDGEPVTFANRVDVVSFSILNSGGTYKVFGQLASFG